MEKIFAHLFEKSISPTAVVVGPNYEIVLMNEAWVRLFGFTKEEAIGRNWYELGINRNTGMRSQVIAQLKEYGSLSGLKYVLFSKSGREIDVINDMTRIEYKGREYVLSTLHDITEFEQAVKARKEEDASLLENLTGREQDVIKLVVAGHSTKDIAKILGISPRTVEVYRSSIIQKLGTKSLLNLKRIVDSWNL